MFYRMFVFICENLLFCYCIFPDILMSLYMFCIFCVSTFIGKRTILSCWFLIHISSWLMLFAHYTLLEFFGAVNTMWMNAYYNKFWYSVSFQTVNNYHCHNGWISNTFYSPLFWLECEFCLIIVKKCILLAEVGLSTMLYHFACDHLPCFP